MHGAERRQRFRAHRRAQHQLEALGRCDARHQRVEGAVVQEASPVDHDDARCQGGDVLHVMGRQQNRGAVTVPVAAEKTANRILRAHVEAERRLVEKQNRRPVQQGSGQLALHPLAERELPHRLVDDGGESQEIDQLRAALLEIRLGDVVDRPVQEERLFRGEIPHELLTVAEHQCDAALERRATRPGFEPRDPHLPARGVEQAGEHLQRGRLAGAVGSEKGDDLAGLDLEADLAHRLHLAVAGAEQRPHGAGQPRVADFDAKCLREGLRDDGGRHTAGNVARGRGPRNSDRSPTPGRCPGYVSTPRGWSSSRRRGR